MIWFIVAQGGEGEPTPATGDPIVSCKEDTQYESRVVADQVSTIMQDLYPVSWVALMEGETE